MSRPARTRTVRLNLAGSILFGLVLIGLGYLFMKYVGQGDLTSGEQAVTATRAGWGMMIVGGVIVAGNIVWVIFCMTMARRQG